MFEKRVKEIYTS